jgi:hypothetical protein
MWLVLLWRIRHLALILSLVALRIAGSYLI